MEGTSGNDKSALQSDHSDTKHGAIPTFHFLMTN